MPAGKDKTMKYQNVLMMLQSIPYLSVGLDAGADFTWMSIMLPNGILTGKPFKIIHSDPASRELAVTKIKEAQEAYSLESRCFLESTGIYHIPLLCFLRDKGFDCSVINPIITKNSTNMNVRKLHNDKFESTTPVQALKHCARLLRRRSQHLPFIPAKAGMKAGYESFFVSSSTHNRTYLAVPLSLYFEIVSYTHFPDSLHNSLLLLHFHAHSLSLHNNLMTRNFLPRVFS